VNGLTAVTSEADDIQGWRGVWDRHVTIHWNCHGTRREAQCFPAIFCYWVKVKNPNAPAVARNGPKGKDSEVAKEKGLGTLALPILLGLARDRWRFQVLDLHPTPGATRAIGYCPVGWR
jgi:hypothetical protein